MEHRRYQQTEQQYANERLRYYTERLNKGYLQELIPYQNFVTWRYTFDKKKLPINPLTGKPASPTDPATWGTLKEALKRLEVGYTNERTGRREWDHGLGFALGNTPFTAIDVDHTVGTNRTVYYPGKGALRHFNSYSEQSPNDGAHILVEAEVPNGGIKRNGFEMYSKDRYITLTLNHIPGTPISIEQRQKEVNAIYARLNPSPLFVAHTTPQETTVFNREEESPSYIQAIERGLRHDTTGLFGRLLHGDATLWEGENKVFASRSDADFYLARQLAFWTYGNAEQIDMAFRSPALYREKWDERRGQKTYGQLTIEKAIAYYKSRGRGNLTVSCFS